MINEATEFKTFLMLYNLPDESLLGKYCVRVVIPNLLKLTEGLLVHSLSLVWIIKSNQVVELFKDFAAIQLVSTIDISAFFLCRQGFFGKTIKDRANKTCKAELQKHVNNKFSSGHSLCVFALLFSSIAAWSYFIDGQLNKRFARMKYPKCEEDRFTGYKNFVLLSDGQCNRRLNTKTCGFDDGDCTEFNINYPGCKASEPESVGNSICEDDDLSSDRMTSDCKWDGLDCCKAWYPYEVGDGRCHQYDEYINTAACGFDGGDCDDFNANYPDCNTAYPYMIGNGRCHQWDEYMNTAACGFDGGDCDDFNANYPDCNTPYPSWVGDGYCDQSDEYINTADCGFDGGDCL